MLFYLHNIYIEASLQVCVAFNSHRATLEPQNHSSYKYKQNRFFAVLIYLNGQVERFLIKTRLSSNCAISYFLAFLGTSIKMSINWFFVARLLAARIEISMSTCEKSFYVENFCCLNRFQIWDRIVFTYAQKYKTTFSIIKILAKKPRSQESLYRVTLSRFKCRPWVKMHVWPSRQCSVTRSKKKLS